MDVINSIPESLATAILTASFTGLLLLYFQKRIENSFAKSLLEHQTKFVTLHEKQVQTLESLYRMYLSFSDKVAETLYKFYFPPTPSGREEWKRSKGDLLNEVEKHEDFNTYYRNNRLFLPSNIINEIENILSNLFFIQMLIATLMLIYDSDKEQPELIQGANRLSQQILDSSISEVNPENPDLNSFRDDIIREVRTQVSKLEKLYKSIAEPIVN
jgi:hypothetical protein